MSRVGRLPIAIPAGVTVTVDEANVVTVKGPKGQLVKAMDKDMNIAVEDMGFLIRELCDYANMMSQLSPKYDKYPRHFLTTHKIACRNYNRMKKEFSEELFKKRINKQYECSFGDYIFIYPESTQDIKDEATMQNNCVASYIDKVIDGECHILFLRKKNKPDESLVTIEVRNNHIVQARRRFNDDVTAEDQKAIDAFNKKFANKEDKVA